jgi:hypothetical protein
MSREKPNCCRAQAAAVVQNLEKRYEGVVPKPPEVRTVVNLVRATFTSILKFWSASSKLHGAGEGWIFMGAREEVSINACNIRNVRACSKYCWSDTIHAFSNVFKTLYSSAQRMLLLPEHQRQRRKQVLIPLAAGIRLAAPKDGHYSWPARYGKFIKCDIKQHRRSD